MGKSKKQRLFRIIIFLAVACIALLVAFPVYWLVRSSLMSDTQMFVWPLNTGLRNLDGRIIRMH